MNTILEDRLRSHFAEQAARDVLEEPDPRTVMARSQAAEVGLSASRLSAWPPPACWPWWSWSPPVTTAARST